MMKRLLPPYADLVILALVLALLPALTGGSP